MGEREGGDSEKEDVFVCYSMLPPGWWFSCSVCLAHIHSIVRQPFPCDVIHFCFFSHTCLIMPTVECGCVFIAYYIAINMVILADGLVLLLFTEFGNRLCDLVSSSF